MPSRRTEELVGQFVDVSRRRSSPFSRHIFDGGSADWKDAVTATFRLIDQQRRGRVDVDDVKKGMRDYQLVRCVFPESEDADEFFEEDDEVCEELFLTKFCAPRRMRESFIPMMPCLEDAEFKAIILDLDGTMYRPGSLIDGAQQLFAYLQRSQMPYVFLSNTGAKSTQGIQTKLMNPPYKLSDDPIPKDHILTAADAQAEYMCSVVPVASRLLVVSGGGEFWRALLRSKDPDLYDSWTIKTTLTDEEAMAWAVDAGNAYARAMDDDDRGAPRVVVAFFLDGQVGDGWRYDLIKHCAFLLSHGAYFVYTADDPYNPSADDRFAGSLFPLPGPGMFASMLRVVLPLGAEELGRWACCGKGGNVGHDVLVERAVTMLKDQGHDGPRSSILLVGDRYATDIRAGTRAGFSTCLVESGCNRIDERGYFPCDRPSFWAPSVASLVNGGGVRTTASNSSASSSSSSICSASADVVPTTTTTGGLITDDTPEEKPKMKPIQRSPSVEQELQRMPASDLLRAWWLKAARYGTACRVEDVRDLLKLYFVKILEDGAFTIADFETALTVIGVTVPRQELLHRISLTPARFAHAWKTPKARPPCQKSFFSKSENNVVTPSEFTYVMESFLTGRDSPRNKHDRRYFSPVELLLAQSSDTLMRGVSTVLSNSKLSDEVA